jgi:outer membrane receptor for ferrienterochelin and colicin
LVWQPRGAWRIDAGLRSELSAAAEINASYARLNGVNAAATWFATDKSRLRASIDLLDRQFQNNVIADQAQVPARKDLIVALTAGLSIQLWRTLELAADWRLEDRKSNQANFDYRAHTLVVRLGAVF